MDWFLYDNSLGHERVNPVHPSVAFPIEISHLICTANEMTVSKQNATLGINTFGFLLFSGGIKWEH